MRVAEVVIERLSKSGAMSCNGVVIQSYPELEPLPLEDDLPIVAEPIVAECKANGANTRCFRDDATGQKVCLSRGGFREPKSEDALEKIYGGRLDHLFVDFPNVVLCLEIAGRGTPANLNAEYYLRTYGAPAVAMVFDAFEKGEGGRWLSAEELNGLCSKYGLLRVPALGAYGAGEGRKLLDDMGKIPAVFEGVVAKAAAARERDRAWKLRFEYFRDHFQDRVVEAKGEKAPPPPEAVILGHFLEGYGEPELGLREGMGPEERATYDGLMRELAMVVRENKAGIGEKVGEIAAWVVGALAAKGSFDGGTLQKIGRAVRQRIGREVPRMMAQGGG